MARKRRSKRSKGFPKTALQRQLEAIYWFELPWRIRIERYLSEKRKLAEADAFARTFPDECT